MVDASCCDGSEREGRGERGIGDGEPARGETRLFSCLVVVAVFGLDSVGKARRRFADPEAWAHHTISILHCRPWAEVFERGNCKLPEVSSDFGFCFSNFAKLDLFLGFEGAGCPFSVRTLNGVKSIPIYYLW